MTVAPRSAPDLGDGTFLNPVLPGDRPDPAVLRVGDLYYLTHSSFDASPGLAIWRSPDLVNWTFYLYIPFIPSAWSDRVPEPQIWVTQADSPEGPWSEPTFTGVSGAIDPGPVVGEDGERYFTRVSLEPGASVTVSFRIDDDDLRFWADGVHRVLEPGDFTFTISDGAVEHRLGVRLEECA